MAIVAAAFFLLRSDQQIADSRAAVRAFDLHAREATDAVADLRVAQQAYVADGQGVAYWMPKVAGTTATVRQAIASLKGSARGAGARSSLDEASASVEEFGNIDKRARDYLKAGQRLMAGDVIFTEGGDAAATAARQVESARLAERQAHDASEARLHNQETIALGVAAGLVALVVLALAVPGNAETAMPSLDRAAAPLPTPALPDAPARQRPATTDMPPRTVSLVLKGAAELFTDFGRLRDQDDLQRLMARAAEMIDAVGLVVWLGSASGSDLRPMLTHGYPPHVVAQMPTVPRLDDNAAAAAYRTGQFQIVMERPGISRGAVVAPILSTDGCIGALSAEIRSGGEASETVQALTAMVAAQLATVLSALPAADTDDQRVAASS
jgi:hypothetical protein